MNRRRTVCIALTCFAIVTFPVAAADSKSDPQEKLETMIPEMIRLLKAKEYVAFIKTYVAPEDLKKVKENRTVEQWAEWFGKNRADKLIKTLELIRNAKPTLDAELAIYALKEEPHEPRELIFVKIENRWYMTQQGHQPLKGKR